MQPENEQAIFGPYWDGLSQVYADPMEVYRELQKATAGQLRQVLKDARATGPADAEGDDAETLTRKSAERADAEMRAWPAVEKLLAASRSAFHMTPFDRATGKGATERDCHKAVTAFFAFLTAEKKTGESSPTSAPPSAGAVSVGP